MITKTKPTRCQHHNFIKVKALYFLSQVDTVTSGKIATAINANPASLYVLLGRWVKWEYIRRYRGADIGGSQYLYQLAPKGRVYLSRLPDWYNLFDQAKEEVKYEVSKYTWVWGRTGKSPTYTYHVIKAPYKDPNADYFTTIEQPQWGHGSGGYIDNLFSKAKEITGRDPDQAFKNYVREKIIRALDNQQ